MVALNSQLFLQIPLSDICDTLKKIAWIHGDVNSWCLGSDHLLHQSDSSCSTIDQASAPLNTQTVDHHNQSYHLGLAL